MGHITSRGRMVVSYGTMKQLKTKVRSIDRRLAGKRGMTKSGKVIQNPRAYVFGGLRKHLK
jgi:hypothetical protein